MAIAEIRPRRGLSREAVKYIAALAMLLNHIASVCLTPGTLLREVLIDAGYFTAVTMCYFLAEGFRHTRSRRRYALRLAVFAAVSELPFCLAFTENGILAFQGMNMLFTLLLCFGILAVLEEVESSAVRCALVTALVLLSLVSDWPLLAPLFTLLFRRAGGGRRRTAAAFAAAAGLTGLLFYADSALAGLPPAACLLRALGAAAGPAAAGVAVAFCYSGQRAARGRAFSKWFFYVFYPAHLLLLGLIRVWPLL
ncbi:MAG: conjugal transfer protein TraX [Oscillospiraceae bacterium]|nr:conjugal transfer protein TraX [Oscillospiraceae bacterium]